MLLVLKLDYIYLSGLYIMSLVIKLYLDFYYCSKIIISITIVRRRKHCNYTWTVIFLPVISLITIKSLFMLIKL